MFWRLLHTYHNTNVCASARRVHKLQPAIPGVRVKPNLVYGYIHLVLITGPVIFVLSHTQYLGSTMISKHKGQ